MSSATKTIESVSIKRSLVRIVRISKFQLINYMKPRKTAVFVASKIPLLMKNYVVHTVSKGSYISTSDFIRNAIKEKIERENPDWNMESKGANKDD